MQVRLAANIQEDSIIDGTGIRSVIWFQGCLHNCEGCHNPNTHDLNKGFLKDIEDIKKEIKDLKYQSGITISGGDPFYQSTALLEIVKYAKSINLNIWVYTGFLYEDLVNKYKEILKYIDVLVDGKFDITKKSLNCKFRGSTNQRLIDVNKSLKKGKVILYEV